LVGTIKVATDEKLRTASHLHPRVIELKKQEIGAFPYVSFSLLLHRIVGKEQRSIRAGHWRDITKAPAYHKPALT
jgi:hypothetical protein